MPFFPVDVRDVELDKNIWKFLSRPKDCGIDDRYSCSAILLIVILMIVSHVFLLLQLVIICFLWA